MFIKYIFLYRDKQDAVHRYSASQDETIDFQIRKTILNTCAIYLHLFASVILHQTRERVVSSHLASTSKSILVESSAPKWSIRRSFPLS